MINDFFCAPQDTSFVIPEELTDIPFIHAIYPWVKFARKQLEKKSLAYLKDVNEKALLEMEKTLAQKLSIICTPSLYTELQIYLQQHLFSMDKSSLYETFIQKYFLQKENIQQYLDEYQEINRSIPTVINFWMNHCHDILSRINLDIDLLSKTFNGSKPLGLLTSVKMDTGDSHNGGKAVSILQFSSGKKIIYKPKNLQSSVFFQDLLVLLNQEGLSHDLKPYTILNKEEYGYEEMVEHKPCSSMEEVEGCYYRYGMYLCLLYLLEGTDMHFENVIIQGTYPIIIDHETIFHPSLKSKMILGDADFNVLSVGLLPNLTFLQENEKGMDLGALGSNQITKITKWVDVNTEKMRQESYYQESKSHDCSVRYQNQTISSAEYVDVIVKGFEYMYHFVSNKKVILSKFLLEHAAIMPVRVVLRMTRLYAYILQQLRSSEGLLNEEYRNKILSILERRYLVDTYFPKEIIDEEKKMLLQNDVPFFHTYPDSVSIFSQNSLVAENCLLEPIQTKVLKRIAIMDETDCKKQVSLIHFSYYARNKNNLKNKIHKEIVLHSDNRLLKEEEILCAAELIGKKLQEMGRKSDEENYSWLYLSPNFFTDEYAIKLTSCHLYDGLAGISLFYSALSLLSKDPSWDEMARYCLNRLEAQMDDISPKALTVRIGVGGMSGFAGMIYGIFQSAKILQDERLMLKTKDYLLSIDQDEILQDTYFDLIGGSCGLLLVAITLYDYFQDSQLSSLAIQCADFLISQAKTYDDGSLSWGERIQFLGFSHGTAGISFAFFQLFKLTGNENYKNIAIKALRYERGHFDSEKKNWPRFITKEEMNFQSSWCHGACGIGLGRVSSEKIWHDQEMHQEMEVALSTTLHKMYDSDYTLCCGLCGSIEFLKEYQKNHPDQKIEEKINHAQRVLVDFINRELQEDCLPNPGLMQGLSGYGYTLLRSLDKKNILPQVLLLGI
jgi:type 2 lantibiotic biosynthesis protein LanM